jgi:hypothetical protein
MSVKTTNRFLRKVNPEWWLAIESRPPSAEADLRRSELIYNKYELQHNSWSMIIKRSTMLNRCSLTSDPSLPSQTLSSIGIQPHRNEDWPSIRRGLIVFRSSMSAGPAFLTWGWKLSGVEVSKCPKENTWQPYSSRTLPALVQEEIQVMK